MDCESIKVNDNVYSYSSTLMTLGTCSYIVYLQYVLQA